MEDNDGPLKCSKCTHVFYSQRNLRRHVKRIHEKSVTLKDRVVVCKEKECDETFITIKELGLHLARYHKLEDFEVCENHTFTSKLEFKQWLSAEEQASGSKYVTTTSAKKLPNYAYSTFKCNRSGSFKPTSGAQKQLKAQGSCKIGHHCTSRIILKEYASHIEMTYYKKHYRHGTEVCHLPIPEEEKQKIAGKLLQGISENQIIEDVRSSINLNEIKRRDLITKKDLQNIKSKYGIQSRSKDSVIESDEKIKIRDKTIDAVTKLVTDKNFGNIIKQHKGKITKKNTLNFKRHKEAEQLNLNVLTLSSTDWHISSSYDEDTYIITKKHVCTNTCLIACRLCVICSGAYQCSCHVNTKGNNICKHIHYVLMQLNGNQVFDGPLNAFSQSSTETSDIQPTQTDQHDLIKSELLSLCSQFDTIPSLDDDILQQIKSHLNAIKHLMTVSKQEQTTVLKQRKPVNKRIEKQKRFHSTKKARVTKKPKLSMPSAAKRQIKTTILLDPELYLSSDSTNDDTYF